MCLVQSSTVMTSRPFAHPVPQLESTFQGQQSSLGMVNRDMRLVPFPSVKSVPLSDPHATFFL